MKQFLLIVPLYLISHPAYSQLTGKDSLDYIKEIENYRKEINKKYKKNPKPLIPEDRKKFKSLDFFPIDVNYRLEAVFTKTEGEQPFQIETSTNRKPLYLKYGIVSFMIDSVEYKLNVYQNVVQAKLESYNGYLFIPFTDKSTDLETYGGGRYLDFSIPDTDRVIIDFNKAYNPWCAYNEHFSCPIPPKENHLNTYIKAGEKDYKYGH